MLTIFLIFKWIFIPQSDYLNIFNFFSKYILYQDLLATISLAIIICVFLLRGKIELGDVTSHNIKQLKLLNQVVFPVSYNDKFYKDVLEAGELAKLGTVS